MKVSTTRKIKRKTRPGVLVRFYPTDIADLNRRCADDCTPRENFCRRAIMAAVRVRTRVPAAK